MPSLNFERYEAYLARALRRNRWSVDGPVTKVKYIKSFFGNRLAEHPGAAIKTPRQYARLLHKFVRDTPAAGLRGHSRLKHNLKLIISIVGQNPRANQCTMDAPGPARVGKISRYIGQMLPPLQPYFIRSVNPGFALVSTALFSQLYGKTSIRIRGLNKKNARKIAKEVADFFIRKRNNIVGTSMYPSAVCPCLRNDLCAVNPHCSVVATPGGGAACVPSSNVGRGSHGYPGIANFAGQRYTKTTQPNAPRRPGTTYVRHKTVYWQRPRAAGAPLALVHLAANIWPTR